MSLPETGQPAPAFALPDQHGNMHALEDYRGQIVLVYFYPKALTPGCTGQACALRDNEAALAELGVKALGISPDPIRLLQRFTEKKQLNFALLSDEDHAVAERYGSWGLKKFMGREYMGLHRRSFIIDREGRLAHIMEKVNTRTHHEDVLAWIRANLQ